MGDVGRLFEVGTPIGITRRNIARLGIIQFQYCVFQYDRLLKTKWKYHKVRRRTSGVAIFPHLGLPKPCNEVVLKYGNGDISRSSWVSTRSKDRSARVADHYFDNPQHKNLWKLITPIINITIRKSVRQILSKGDYLVTGCPWHMRFPRPSVFLPKISNPARINWGGILEESRVVRV